MSKKRRLEKDIDDLKKSSSDKDPATAFIILRNVKEGMLSPEEGLKELENDKPPFTDMVSNIIKSGLKCGRLPRKRKSVRYDLWE